MGKFRINAKTLGFLLVIILVIIITLLIVFSSFKYLTSTTSTENINANWTQQNYNDNMSRDSPQTIINESNVNQLVEKWKFTPPSGGVIDSSPLIVGNTAYISSSGGIYAINMTNGVSIWSYNISTLGHNFGLLYQNDVLYAGTGGNQSEIALNATSGQLIWQTLISSESGFLEDSPPMIWNDYLIVGSAGGDQLDSPAPAIRGTLTALNTSTGKIVWQIPLCVGDWVNASASQLNAGADAWTGGSIDNQTGVIYIPCGNPSPDFNASTREGASLYANCMIAVNITNGKVIWYTPLDQEGTVLNLTPPDTHDYDTSWGSELVTVQNGFNTIQEVIAHDKRGDIIAMKATNGSPLWWLNVAYLENPDVIPTVNSNTIVWPNGVMAGGIESYTAEDGNSLYFSDDNQGGIFQLNPTNPTLGTTTAAGMPNGIGNGTIGAINLINGKIDWEDNYSEPVWGSDLVTNNLLFASTVTSTTNGTIMAINKNNGQILWQTNTGTPVSLAGPSIGDGMLLVPTGLEEADNNNGYLIAYGLPNN